MCFKENWASLSTIENTPLDGGKCNSLKSVVIMKKDGWIIDDIKIIKAKNGMNFIYLFKKSLPILNEQDIQSKLIALQKKQKIEVINKKRELSISTGGKIYRSKCASCHGNKGEEKAYNTSRRLDKMTFNEIKTSINAYAIDDKDNGMAIVMKPYATNLETKQMQQISDYLQSLK
jgi:cytochrome c553